MAKIKQQIDTLLHQEMDRKNFLKYGGTVLLAVLGITGLLRVLLAKENASVLKSTDSSTHGYGSSKYGQ